MSAALRQRCGSAAPHPGTDAPTSATPWTVKSRHGSSQWRVKVWMSGDGSGPTLTGARLDDVATPDAIHVH